MLSITVVLLVVAVMVSLLQKYWEGQAAVGVANQLPTAAVAGDIYGARMAQLIGIATALLATMTWGWAFRRGESSLFLHLSVPTLLVLFLFMQLLMV